MMSPELQHEAWASDSVQPLEAELYVMLQLVLWLNSYLILIVITVCASVCVAT